MMLIAMVTAVLFGAVDSSTGRAYGADDVETIRLVDAPPLVGREQRNAGHRGVQPLASDPNAYLLADYQLPSNTPVLFRVNPGDADVDPATALAAVQRAATTWNSDPDSAVVFSYDGPSSAMTSEDRSAADGTNDIFWAPPPAGAEFLGRATMFVDEDGFVVEFNVQLNSQANWVDGPFLGHDIESAVLHELGHALGFEHVDHPSVVMQPTLSIAAPFPDPGTGDRTALLLRYGNECHGALATMFGTAGPDSLVGTIGVDVIATGAGDDDVQGLGGDDIVCSGTGNDTVHANHGDDIVYGGAGNDMLWGNPGNDLLVGNTGDDTLRGGTGSDAGRAGSGNDVLDGGAGDDNLRGGPGNDVLLGDLGDDALFGSTGNDVIFGQRGFDSLFGGPGDDALFGGRAGDELYGQSGDDYRDGGSGGGDLCDAVDDTIAASNCET